MKQSFIKKFILLLNKNFYFKKIFSFIKKIDQFDFVIVDNKKIFFLNTNYTTHYRIKSFFTKEPETIKWINEFENKSVFWDIGSNIGLYSIYSQFINKDIETISFEPSVLNLPSLVKNINKNSLSDKILIVSNPIYNLSLFNKFILSNTDEGGANSSFGEENMVNMNILSYKTNSLDFKNIKQIYKLNEPDYVKIDVDGNEFQILKSLLDNFENIKSILIEVNKDYLEIELLLKEKKFINFFKDKNRSNQIWKKLEYK
jgi:FkbM family methyltransferase